jgi:hypothetical protein
MTWFAVPKSTVAVGGAPVVVKLHESAVNAAPDELIIPAVRFAVKVVANAKLLEGVKVATIVVLL